MTKKNFRPEKRVGKSKAYKADERQKAADQKNRHFDPEKRSEDRRRAAENKKSYSKFQKDVPILLSVRLKKALFRVIRFGLISF